MGRATGPQQYNKKNKEDNTMENAKGKQFDAQDYLAYTEDVLRAIYDLLVKDDPNIDVAATLAQVAIDYIERAESLIDKAAKE